MTDPFAFFHATAALRHRAQRRRRFAAAQAEALTLSAAELGEANARWLQVEELIAPGMPQAGEARLPFVFVRAINLVLRYSCNLACSHCLQTPLRPKGQPQWLEPALVRSLLEQAVELDLLGMGLNVTGGETFAASSSLLEVLEIAAGLGLTARATTNAWWGLQQDIRLGEYLIADYETGVTPIEELLSAAGLWSDPTAVWSHLGRVEQTCRDATSNRGHVVIAAMEQEFERVWMLTQNVDGFHQRAGSRNVIAIHGNLHQLR